MWAVAGWPEPRALNVGVVRAFLRGAKHILRVSGGVILFTLVNSPLKVVPSCTGSSFSIMSIPEV